MAEQAKGTKRRSIITFILVGVLLVGALFGGTALLKNQGGEVAVNGNNQNNQNQQSNQENDNQNDRGQSGLSEQNQQQANNQQSEKEKQAEQRRKEEQAAAEREKQRQQEQQAAEAQAEKEKEQQEQAAPQPQQVASTGGVPTSVPSTGPASDLALSATVFTLLGFGLYRWRQSRASFLNIARNS